MSAVTAAAVWDANKVRVLDEGGFVESLRKAKWGQGSALVVRVEPEEDAYTYAQLKHLYGHVYEPVVAYAGITKVELHAMAKVQHMPEGKTSVTQLSRDELKAFTEAVEQWLREEIGDAYALEETHGRQPAPRRSTLGNHKPSDTNTSARA